MHCALCIEKENLLMRVFTDIEGLMYYANVHLMLDELDIVLVRNQILDLLQIKDYIISEIDYDSVESLTEPSTLLAPILEYAVGANIVSADETLFLASKIMGMLILRPSDLIDVYNGYIKKPQRFSEWFFDYNVKSNYFDSISQHNRHWEAKGTTGKLEVAILNSDISFDKSNKYPECDICIENEGWSGSINHTLRTVPVVLGDQDWFWYFEKSTTIAHKIVIANNHHTKAKFDINSLELLFDFNAVMPHYFVGFDTDASTHSHQHLVGGYKLMPLFKAKTLKTYRSALYPLVEIGLVDWYNTVIRLVGVDKKYILECARYILSYYQTQFGETGFAACLRKDKEGKLILELTLTTGNGHLDNVLKSDIISVIDNLGVVHLDSNVASDIKEIEQFLTKEVKFVSEKLPSHLEKYKPMIEKLLKEVGSSKITPLESELNVRDEINAQCETMLKSIAVYTPEQVDEFFKGLMA